MHISEHKELGFQFAKARFHKIEKQKQCFKTNTFEVDLGEHNYFVILLTLIKKINIISIVS